MIEIKANDSKSILKMKNKLIAMENSLYNAEPLYT